MLRPFDYSFHWEWHGFQFIRDKKKVKHAMLIY